MEGDMVPWLKPQIEEEGYMNNIPPHTEELIPNLQNHTQQQNNVGPLDPNTYVFKHHLGSSFSLPSPKSNFSNLLNINDNININGTTTNNNNDNNNPFGSVFNLESQGFLQTPLLIPGLTLTWLNGFEKKMRKDGNGEVDKVLNYNSNESGDVGKMRNHGKNEDNDYNTNTIIDHFNDENCVAEGDRKGKKKENPSKSLTVKRKPRKKLKNNMHKLRSVMPKISKMDKVSILGDAVDYMKELQQQINDLQSEIESSSPKSFMPLPMTSTMSSLPVQLKEQLFQNNVSSLKNQPAEVEVMVREGGIVNIHMICASKPGVLLSTMMALDSLGLEVHQANISCFNDFSLDVFKAKQHNKDQELAPEQIKAVLLKALDSH